MSTFDVHVAAIRRALVNDLFVELPEAEIGLDDGLQTVVGLDSIGFSELRILCERKFDVQIADDDYVPETFSSVRRLANLLLRLRGQGDHQQAA
jgi:acyl carrier protein